MKLPPATVLTLAILCAVHPAFAHGGYDEQIERADAQLAADPDNAETLFQRGQLHYLHGDWKHSLLDLKQAEKLAPGKYPVDLTRGKAWMAGGKYKAAQKALDRFTTSYPDHPDGFATRARLMVKLENQAAAVADFRRAIALTKNPEPDLYIETANTCIASGNPELAANTLQQGMSKLGEIPSLAGKALELELSLAQYDAALSRVAALQKAAPRPEPWMAKRASILAQSGRLDQSQTAWTELRDHLLALPNLERGSHSMSILLEQSQTALESLAKTETTPR